MTEGTTAHIPSFIRRSGRITSFQEIALEKFLPRYQLCTSQKIVDYAAAFGNDHPVVLEIGFGNGDSLLQQVQAKLDHNFIGVEVHLSGVGRLVGRAYEENLSNLKIYTEDAVLVCQNCIAKNSLQRVQVYFPDPWHKKKHHKRRLLSTDFLQNLIDLLQPCGHLYIATDWLDYRQDIVRDMKKISSVKLAVKEIDIMQSWRPSSKYEQRALRLGHSIYNLIYEKI